VNELSDQVRGIIFVIVALIILFAFGRLYKPAPVAVPPQNSSAPASTQQPGVNSAPGNAAGLSSSAGGSAAAMTAAKPVVNPVVNPGVVQAAAEKTIVVSSPLYYVEISNRGGVVKTWKLNRYMNDQTPPQPLDLVNDAVAQQFGWPFSLVLADPQLEASANSGLYEIETRQASTTVDEKTLKSTAKLKPVAPAPVASAADNVADAPTEVDMHWSDGHLDVTKKLKFDLNYELSVEVTAALDGKPLPVAIAWRGGFGDKAVYKAATLVTGLDIEAIRKHKKDPNEATPDRRGPLPEGSSGGSREVARRNSAPGAGQRRSAPMTTDRTTRETAMADQCDVIVVSGGPAARAANPGHRFHSCQPAHQPTARQPDPGHPRRHLGPGGAWPTGRAGRRRSRGGEGAGF